MNTTKRILSYAETRSANYQSVRVEESVEIEVGADGCDNQAFVRREQETLIQRVGQISRERLEILVRESAELRRLDEGRGGRP